MKTMAMLGAAAGSMFFGQRGQAEGPEAIEMAMRDALHQAENSGNWQIYEDAKQARDELLNTSIWEDIALWTPASVAVGIPTKLKGVAKAAMVMDAIAEDKKKESEGMSSEEVWKQRRQAQRDLEIQWREEDRQYYKEIEEAKKKARAEDKAYYEKLRKKREKEEEERMEFIAKFWLEYHKKKAELNKNIYKKREHSTVTIAGPAQLNKI